MPKADVALVLCAGILRCNDEYTHNVKVMIQLDKMLHVPRPLLGSGSQCAVPLLPSPNIHRPMPEGFEREKTSEQDSTMDATLNKLTHSWLEQV